ncbi:MAG TPA: biopolymer transporter ExbD [Verrucomicrobiae bacterium]|jgi:biopolymer transport protein ExbD|nr:biopolymer transporter ExbD [Verrucomicrobiae bacterium]
MKKTSRSHHSSLNELNITPLLDLVFVLLVIFIITTPQMMNNLEMTLPSGDPPKTKDKPKINQITVDSSGQTFLNDELVNLKELRARLQAVKDAEGDPSVVVKGADTVDYQHMISVLDILQQLNITKVGLATQE